MKIKGPLTKVEKFYIEGNLVKGVDQLAEDLNRTKQAVQHYMEDVQTKAPPKENKNIAPTRPTQQKDGFGRHRGSVVSSQGASQKVDDLQLSKKAKNKKRDGIYKPYSE